MNVLHILDTRGYIRTYRYVPGFLIEWKKQLVLLFGYFHLTPVGSVRYGLYELPGVSITFSLLDIINNNLLMRYSYICIGESHLMPSQSLTFIHRFAIHLCHQLLST